MSIPRDVAEALARIGSVRICGSDTYWQTIRAHLMHQDSEIATLTDRVQFWYDASDAMNDAWQADKDRAGLAESRLAEADALLRKCRDEFAGLPHSLGYDFTHLPELDAHLNPTDTTEPTS